MAPGFTKGCEQYVAVDTEGCVDNWYGDNGVCVDSEREQELPLDEANVEQVTAHWVAASHEQRPKGSLGRLQKAGGGSGIILKVHPDMIQTQEYVRDCWSLQSPSNFRSTGHRLSEEDHFLPCEARVKFRLNKSMPVLVHTDDHYSDRFQHSECQINPLLLPLPSPLYNTQCLPMPENRYKSSDIQQQQLKFRPSSSPDNRSSATPCQKPQLMCHSASGSKIPLDLTPIITIQNYDSKSSRKKSSLSRTASQDSTSSTSSNDPLLLTVPLENWQCVHPADIMINNPKSDVDNGVRGVGENETEGLLNKTKYMLSRSLRSFSDEISDKEYRKERMPPDSRLQLHRHSWGHVETKL